MFQKGVKFLLTIILILAHITLLVENGYAENPSVRLIINPNKTDVDLGSDPIALTAKATGSNLTYRWELKGPGKIDGEGSAVFYVLPEKIKGKSEQALVTVTVTDAAGQETTETVTFNILAATSTKTASPQPAKKGMSKTTKIALGVGAAAALGGGIALLAGGDDDSDSGINVVGIWNQNYDWGCDGSFNVAILDIRDDNTIILTDWNGEILYPTWSLEGNQFTYVYTSGTTYTGTVDSTENYMEGTMVSWRGSTGCWSATRTSSAKSVVTGNESRDAAGNCRNSSEHKECK